MSEPTPEKSTADTPQAAEDSSAPRLRAAAETIGQVTEAFANVASPADEPDSDKPINWSPVARMANAIITTGIEKRASDIFIEPANDSFYVRCRVDGVLRLVITVPKHVYNPTLNRFKVMAEIPFWAKAPQVGHILVRYSKKPYDLAVTTAPTRRGDTLHLRIYDPELPRSGLRALGMDENTEYKVQGRQYGGLLLIVGPPGAGKTTTAYALMRHLNWSGWVTATLEDRHTYAADGLIQTYRTAQRTAREIAGGLIAQEAHVVFGGDLLDRDMAEAAFAVAEAGATAVACVTAPSAAGALQHLLNLGVAPARLSANISAVLMQTLVATVCPDCKRSVSVGPEEINRLNRFRESPPPYAPAATPGTHYVMERGDGCPTCEQWSIRGQTGLFEYLPLDGETRHLLRQADAEAQIARSPWAQGAARALHESALAAVYQHRIGLTDAEHAVFPLTGAARRAL